MVFIWLESVELAKNRVKKRVSEGGHDIPADVIERRYLRGLKNLFDIFIPACRHFLIVNNSGKSPEIIVRTGDDNKIVIHNSEIWKKIKSYP